ncbi:hypothetical protein B0H13DRAFT_2361091 [Mycena leptocephala]|nr:hypothetical protein B0H13DRAFT_2361091 [Mycena leptocephala]
MSTSSSSSSPFPHRLPLPSVAYRELQHWTFGLDSMYITWHHLGLRPPPFALLPGPLPPLHTPAIPVPVPPIALPHADVPLTLPSPLLFFAIADADLFRPLALWASHLLADDDRRADEFLGSRLRLACNDYIRRTADGLRSSARATGSSMNAGGEGT